MGTLKLQSVSPVVVQSSGTSQTNNTRVKAGTLDNTSGTGSACPSWDFALAGGFGSAPTVGPGIVVALYALPWVDGTNAASADTTTPNFPKSTFLGYFEIDLSQTPVQYMVVPGVQLNALKYDLWLDNQSGETLSSGWALTATPTDYQY